MFSFCSSTEIRLKPSQIRFSQNSIYYKFFRRSETLNDTANSFSGSADNYPSMTVVIKDRKMYALDNRRLYLFRVLERKGMIKDVPVYIRAYSSSDSRKFTTQNDGDTITFTDMRRAPTSMCYPQYHGLSVLGVTDIEQLDVNASTKTRINQVLEEIEKEEKAKEIAQKPCYTPTSSHDIDTVTLEKSNVDVTNELEENGGITKEDEDGVKLKGCNSQGDGCVDKDEEIGDKEDKEQVPAETCDIPTAVEYGVTVSLMLGEETADGTASNHVEDDSSDGDAVETNDGVNEEDGDETDSDQIPVEDGGEKSEISSPGEEDRKTDVTNELDPRVLTDLESVSESIASDNTPSENKGLSNDTLEESIVDNEDVTEKVQGCLIPINSPSQPRHQGLFLDEVSSSQSLKRKCIAGHADSDEATYPKQAKMEEELDEEVRTDNCNGSNDCSRSSGESRI